MLDTATHRPTEPHREERFPIGSRVRIADLERDPYPILGELREHEPVSWIPALGMWFLTRHADIVAVLHDPESFTTDHADSTIQDTFGRQMLSVDGENHRRYKHECLGSFTGKAARDIWAPRIERRTRELLDEISDARPSDLMRNLARPLSLQTMAIVLGLPLEDLPRVHASYESFAAALANFAGEPSIRQRGRGAAGELRVYLERRLEQELDPDSLLARLEAVIPDRLTLTEASSNLMIVLFGGIETTESMIGNALWALLSHRDLTNDLADNDRLVDALIEESLRWEPAVQSLTRRTTRDVEIEGVVIPQGEALQCMIGGANRDPALFEDPDSFDLARKSSRRHLSFGLASHFCLGAQLARIEAGCAVREVLRQLPDLRLDAGRPCAPRGHEFRKPPELWVTWN